MMCPLLIDRLEHVGFRNLLQGGTGRLPRPAYRHRAIFLLSQFRRCSFAPARSGHGMVSGSSITGLEGGPGGWAHKAIEYDANRLSNCYLIAAAAMHGDKATAAATLSDLLRLQPNTSLAWVNSRPSASGKTERKNSTWLISAVRNLF
jgi:hypothetical protein